VSVTIDDGYVDALQFAKIILEKQNVPATIFVTAGYLGSEFWWDKLDLDICVIRPWKITG
jgi:peptidoglycan/xylan/chitin deacetylase (PgdA/CDA1 family)